MPKKRVSSHDNIYSASVCCFFTVQPFGSSGSSVWPPLSACIAACGRSSGDFLSASAGESSGHISRCNDALNSMTFVVVFFCCFFSPYMYVFYVWSRCNLMIQPNISQGIYMFELLKSKIISNLFAQFLFIKFNKDACCTITPPWKQKSSYKYLNTHYTYSMMNGLRIFFFFFFQQCGLSSCFLFLLYTLFSCVCRPNDTWLT